MARASSCRETAPRLAGLPKADGLILVDAHPGVSVNMLRGLDPRVLDESDPFKLDASLDPLDPGNGYNPSGPTRYSAEFKRRYHEAQSARMNRLIDSAQYIVRRMDLGQYKYRDDDLFLVTQPASGGLRRDLSVNDVTHQPRRLLKDDGTIVTQIIERVVAPTSCRLAESMSLLPTHTTIRRVQCVERRGDD